MISAPKEGELVISFIGYHSQIIPVSGKTNIKVTLEENLTAIDDVIVIAFGTTKKEAFTGSATVIKSEDLEKRQTANVMNSLVGSVAGLQMRSSSGQPGSSGSVNIRGISSMYSDTEPLVILDGAPYTASLSNIPQSDIESVTVLKDAASAALYGARGASGVIIVTTKRGKAKDASISVDMKWGVNSKALQDYDRVTDPGEYYEAYYAQLYNNNFYNKGMSAVDADLAANQDMLKNLAYNVYTYPAGENLIVNGKLNPNATLGRKVTVDGKDLWMQPDDWMDAAYKNSLRQEYNISLNGSSDRSSYYLSMSYLNEDGIIDNSDYERIAARVRADYQARKWLKVGTNIGYTNSTQNLDANSGAAAGGNSSNLFGFASQIAPIYPIYIREVDANGNVSIAKDKYGNPAYDYGVAATSFGVTRPYLATGNPLGSNKYNQYTSLGNQLNASAFADIDITPWLKANVTTTLIWGGTEVTDYSNMFYGNSASVGGELAKQQSYGIRTNNVQSLTYYNSFNDVHNVNVMLGHEYYNAKTRTLGASRKGLFSPDILELGAAASMKDSSSSSTEYNVEGFFLSAQYDYNNKYYVSGSFRRDASSYFAKNNRWGNFWSIGAAWILSKENFMKNQSWVDMIKIKASIGQQGNDGIGSYGYVDLYSLSKYDDTSMQATFARKGNSDITWETLTNFNAGVEFSFWHGRLNGTLDVYSKKTTDLLFWVSIPESSGTRGMYSNIGDMRNSGVELSLTGSVIRTKMVDWSLSFNISTNKTKILDLPDAKIAENGGFTDHYNGYVNYWFKEGGEMYNYYDFKYAGVNEHGESLFYKDIVELDSEGNEVVVGKTTTTEFQEATEYEHGSILPKAFGGFSTSLRVGNFDLGATFDYQLGGKVYDMGYQGLIGSHETASSAGMAIHKDWKKAWSPTNTQSNMPRWNYTDRYSSASSDRFLTDASYLNFQSFTVGYTIPAKVFANKLKMRIYAAGENLVFWSARKGLDPRFAYDGNLAVSGYSPIRTISGGIQLTF